MTRVPEVILLFIIATVVVWNCFFAPPHGAVSDVVRRVSVRQPFVPFLFGMLAGHLFWPLR
jgi:hypothetical protein